MKIPRSALSSNASLKRWLSYKIERYAYDLEDEYFYKINRDNSTGSLIIQNQGNIFYFKLHFYKKIYYFSNFDDFDTYINFVNNHIQPGLRASDPSSITSRDLLGRDCLYNYFLHVSSLFKGEKEFAVELNIYNVDLDKPSDYAVTDLYITVDELNNRLEKPYDLSKLITFNEEQLVEYCKTMAKELIRYYSELVDYIYDNPVKKLEDTYNEKFFNEIVKDKVIENLDFKTSFQKAFDMNDLS